MNRTFIGYSPAEKLIIPQPFPADPGNDDEMPCQSGPTDLCGCGGVLRWGYPNSWMVFVRENSHLEMDDDWG